MPHFLVADDDPASLQLMAELLHTQAEVRTASSAAAALRMLVNQEFDLFLTDLDIDQPSDGLMLGGVNRTLHPQARNVLITGYPDFIRALADIQATFDQVLLKPLDTAALRSLGAHRLEQPLPSTGKLRIHELIARHQVGIAAEWLRLVENDLDLQAVPMSSDQRLDHLTELLEALCRPERRPELEGKVADTHGRERKKLGYRPELISLEISILRQVMMQLLLRNLLRLDLSRFPEEMFLLNLRLDKDLMDSLRAYGLESLSAGS